MITVFYFIVFLLSLLMVGTIVFRNKKVDSLLVVFSLMITLNCFGRFLLSASTTLDLAIVSNKILYIGGCYSPLLAVFVLGRLCDVKIPRVLSVILICFSIIFMYVFERVLDIKVSIMPVGYLIGITLLINYFDRLNMYDMSANIVATIEKMNDYGYIVFDNKYRFISANQYLKNIFPEIKSYFVDGEVKESDVFDALVSKRCYKEAFSYDEAFNIIEDSLGSHFDPELGRIFIGCRIMLEEIYNQNC